MTQQELIKRLAQFSNTTQEQASEVIEGLAQVIGELGPDEIVRHSALGTFSVDHRPARKGRNPRTGEPIDIAAKRSGKFRQGKCLSDRLNHRYIQGLVGGQ